MLELKKQKSTNLTCLPYSNKSKIINVNRFTIWHVSRKLISRWLPETKICQRSCPTKV